MSMIDVKTRRKIVKLKEEGYSNTEIKNKTGVSYPTVRKILREKGLETGKNNPLGDDSSIMICEELDERLVKVEQAVSDEYGNVNSNAPGNRLVYDFVLNFTRVLPHAWAEGNVWKALSQGVAQWRYTKILRSAVSQEVVSAVDQRIQEYDRLPGKVFRVMVTARDYRYDARVELLLDEMS